MTMDNIRKKRLIIGVSAAVAIVALFFATERAKERDVPFEMVNAESKLMESSRFGVINRMSGYDSVSIVLDDGSNIVYNLLPLAQSDRVVGRLRQGDRISVELGNDGKPAYVANLSMLSGRWVEPSPVDEGREQGIELELGGAATSINLRTIYYRTWYLHQNKLSLYYVTEGREKSTDAEHDDYEIVHLSQDSLVLKGRDVKLMYTRQKAKHSSDEEVSDFANDDTQDYSLLINEM